MQNKIEQKGTKEMQNKIEQKGTKEHQQMGINRHK
jgi:hypothetical protein